MEKLIINIPSGKIALVKQILKELGVSSQPYEKSKLRADKNKLKGVSIWTEKDLENFDEAKKSFGGLTPQEW